jgi:hypothetical protein
VMVLSTKLLRVNCISQTSLYCMFPDRVENRVILERAADGEGGIIHFVTRVLSQSADLPC